MTISTRQIFRTYFQVAKRYPVTGILTFLCFGIGVVLNDLILKLYYRDIFDLIAGSAPDPALWPALIAIFVKIVIVVFAFNIFWRIGDFCITYQQANTLRELANFALERLQRHSYAFFIGNFTGSLVAKTKRFVRAFETLHDKIVFNFWMTGIELVGILAILWYTSPPLGVFFLCWCVFYLGITYVYVRYRFPFDAAIAEADSAETGDIADVVTNILNVKMFTSSTTEIKRFMHTTKRKQVARLRAWNRDNIFRMLQSLTMAALEVIGMYIALRLWLSGDITAGTIILVQTYFIMVSRSAWELRQAMSDFFRSLSDAVELVEIIQQPLEVDDPAVPETCRIESGKIDFQNVSFCYVPDKTVLSHLDLSVPGGQRVGLVGRSGEGKSTLFKLLLRFLDVSDGSILIDGQDIRSITQDDLRKHISYVPQDPVLFHRSLYENIVYAKPEASKEEVVAAAKQAHADEFISQCPDGYDTLVGERGVKLSGGERQRVAIARAILKNAPILLLDEATSSLDSVSEKYIQEQLKELMKGKTTLAIAHRISTINQMDRIIVMQHGKIAEDGTHKELLEADGTYAELWSHQSDGFILE
jgi:ATP-binding cassette subfamily B protein